MQRDVAETKPEGWREAAGSASLPEVHRSLLVPHQAGFWRKLLAFSGPGYLVAVGYMDPGNWATDIAGGSSFGYRLLSVILISNFIAILLQALSLRLGIATGRDLAQACRDHFSRPVNIMMWVLCEIAIAACDLAEVIGSAIALNLLFKIPLMWGVCITGLDVLVLLLLQHHGFRLLEALVVTLMGTIALCFGIELFLANPNLAGIAHGLVPSPEIIGDKDMRYIALGILGATVMPHNLYLHSSIVQTRKYQQDYNGKREAVKFATLDSTIALMFALFINAAILIVAADAFHRNGLYQVAEIEDAYKLLPKFLGPALASTLFALALLASGQNSTLTGTLAGQIVMEGYLNLRMRPWMRRMLTRAVAIVPAIVATKFYGHHGTTNLLLFSQVILSLQLSFAVIPLVMFTGDKKKMGAFVSPLWVKCLAWSAALLIAGLNAQYLWGLAFNKGGT